MPGDRELKINHVINLLEETVREKERELSHLKRTDFLRLANAVLKTFETLGQSQAVAGDFLHDARQKAKTILLKMRRELEERPYAFLGQVAVYSFALGMMLESLGRKKKPK